MELLGARALVTGGTGGLGRVICETLAEAGVNVMLGYRDSSQLAETLAAQYSEKHGVQVIAVRADTSDEESIETISALARDRLGGLEILVNNAAINRFVPFQDLDALTPEVWDSILNTNLRGPFLLTRALASLLAEEGRGRVVNVSSIGGLIPSASSMAYAVSKAGLIHLTRCLAVSMAPRVTVNCVAPGMLDGTRATENLSMEFRTSAVEKTLLKVEASKEDVARQVLAFCRSDTVTGQTAVIDSGVVFN